MLFFTYYFKGVAAAVRQLGETQISILSTYAQRESTKLDHTALIRGQYRYFEFGWPWSFRLSRPLYTQLAQ